MSTRSNGDGPRTPDLTPFPGGDLVTKGLIDLAAGHQTEESLLVMIAADNLRRLDLPVGDVPTPEASYELSLYDLINARNPDGAHAEYNALIARLVSFEQTYGRAVRRR